MRELLQVILELDYQSISCDNGRQALEIVRQIKPDLVLLDMHLAGDMSGLEVCYLLRAAPASANLPILILSGETSRADIRRSLAAGANGYVTKPYSPRYLLDRIGTLLGKYYDSGVTPRAESGALCYS